MAREVGARIVIANVGPIAMDGLADVFLDGPAGEILPRLIEEPAGSG
jgi:NAD-dependent SIR2 family protein deacetylase